MACATRTKLVSATAVIVLCAGGAGAQECFRWSDDFTSGNFKDPARAWTVFDDGSGEMLYAGGGFRPVHWLVPKGVARLNGDRWEQVGEGVDTFVFDFAVGDVGGAGEWLFAGGPESGGGTVQYWTGSGWEIAGEFDGDVWSLDVHEGTLVVGGEFTQVDGVDARNIAMWDGQQWAPMSFGMNAPVRAVCSFDGGSGPILVAGGEFTTAGINQVDLVAQWDGANWTWMGSGLPRNSGDPTVYTLDVVDLGSGPALYAGGGFGDSMQQLTSIARWDGNDWQPVGGILTAKVFDITTFDDGMSVSLVVAGQRSGVLRMNGLSWEPLGELASSGDAHALQQHNGGGEPRLWVTGNFDVADGIQANGVAWWNADRWQVPLPGFFDRVERVVGVDEPGGPVVYVSGQFQSIGSGIARHVAKWDGQTWSGLAGGTNDQIWDMAAFDGGSGEQLFVTGRLTQAGGVPAGHIAKWDGAAWSPVGGGLNAEGRRLLVWDDGTGPALYAAGDFTVAGLVGAAGVARWNGAFWSSVGDGVPRTVLAMESYDDGAGSELYIASTTAGNPGLTTVRRWDGQVWTTVGPLQVSGTIYALKAWQGSLYVGGQFTSVNGVQARSVARWDGDFVHSFGQLKLQSGQIASVFDLEVFDSGGGERLYAGGHFGLSGINSSIRDISVYNGNGWVDLDGGTDNGGVYGLGVAADSQGEGLFAVGFFNGMSGVSSGGVAKLERSACCYADCETATGIGVLDVFDFLCFQDAFVSEEPYACDCDQSTGAGVCDIFDFLCFQDAFTAGCP